MGLNDNISISNEIEAVIKECLDALGQEKIKINQGVFRQIQKELNFLQKYYIQINSRFLKSSTYSAFAGFNYSSYHYEISATKEQEALVYQHLNNILALLRNNQHLTYVLYVNEKIDEQRSQQYRYEVPAEQLDEFLKLYRPMMR